MINLIIYYTQCKCFYINKYARGWGEVEGVRLGGDFILVQFKASVYFMWLTKIIFLYVQFLVYCMFVLQILQSNPSVLCRKNNNLLFGDQRYLIIYATLLPIGLIIEMSIKPKPVSNKLDNIGIDGYLVSNSPIIYPGIKIIIFQGPKGRDKRTEKSGHWSSMHLQQQKHQLPAGKAAQVAKYWSFNHRFSSLKIFFNILVTKVIIKESVCI